MKFDFEGDFFDHRNGELIDFSIVIGEVVGRTVYQGNFVRERTVHLELLLQVFMVKPKVDQGLYKRSILGGSQ
jgi:hypothetical protein